MRRWIQCTAAGSLRRAASVPSVVSSTCLSLTLEAFTSIAPKLVVTFSACGSRCARRSKTPTPESQAEYDAVADLRALWREAALREFIANEHLDVRRSILPLLPLNPDHYPPNLHDLVADAFGAFQRRRYHKRGPVHHARPRTGCLAPQTPSES